MPFYKDFEDKPSKRDDWRDDARTLRPGQSNGGRPSHAARNQGGMRMPGRNVASAARRLRAAFAAATAAFLFPSGASRACRGTGHTGGA